MKKSISHFSVKLLAVLLLSVVAGKSAQAQIFDIDTPGDNVYKYPFSGGATSAQPFISVNGYASGLAYSNGNLFVAQNGDGAKGSDVTEYNASTGAQITGFAGTGAITGLNNPEGLAVDGSTLFVANRTNSTGAVGSVAAYDINTGTGSTLISNLFQPTALALSGGDLYVALNNGGGSGAAGSIEEFNETTGAQISAFSITGLAEPQGLAFDGGNLFVTNEGTNTIGEYNGTTGAFIKNFAGPTNSYGITALPNSDLLVTSDSPGSHVTEYDMNGTLLSSDYLTGSNYELAIVAAPEPSGLGMVTLALVGFSAFLSWRSSSRTV